MSIFFSRIVRLISPKLNYVMIMGAIFLYASVYCYVLPVDNMEAQSAACVV